MFPTLSSLTNPGFEEGAVGEAPPGWSFQPAIQPTVPVAPARRGVAAGKDEVLEKAFEVVGG